MRTKTVDLEEEAREIREEQIPEIEEAQDELVEKLRDEYGEFGNVPSEYRQTYQQFEEELVELRGELEAIEQVVEEWEDATFVIGELTTGQLANVQDRVSEKSFEFDPQQGEMVDGTPKQGYGMIEVLRESIQHQPDGAPTRIDPETGNEVPEPAEYPSQIGMLLFEKVNSLNTVGDTDMGNSSLRERMKN